MRRAADEKGPLQRLISHSRRFKHPYTDFFEIDPDVAADALDQQAANSAATSPQRLTIMDAKRGLAETLGIDREKIEINIRG